MHHVCACVPMFARAHSLVVRLVLVLQYITCILHTVTLLRFSYVPECGKIPHLCLLDTAHSMCYQISSWIFIRTYYLRFSYLSTVSTCGSALLHRPPSLT